MVFSSLTFICVFLPAVLLLYNLSRNITYRNVILTASSLVFYAWGEPSFIILLIAATIVNYCLALGIDRRRGKAGYKALFALAVIFDIGMIGVFKYAAFVMGSINAVFHMSFPVPEIGLPLGISFYTFQILTYVVDVYKGNTQVQKSYLKFLCFVSMFPQLIAGPIVRYSEVAAALDKRTVRMRDFADGSVQFTFGLAKKVLLANTAGEAKDLLFAASTHPTVGSTWLGIIFYGFQLFFDFSGYSDMAIGMGKMLGFKFPQNFNYPYISRSVSEFWRRWHMTLGSFFRDYVYIPLGGNRCSSLRWVFNTMVVWMLTGLWHGAYWNYVLWGLYYGVLLMLEKLVFKRIKDIPVLSHVITLLLVTIGWVLFYFNDMSDIKLCLLRMIGVGVPLYDITTTSALYSNMWLLAACAFVSTPIPYRIYEYAVSLKYVGVVIEGAVMVVLFVVCIAALTGATSNPFLYFRF
ncbi:MAG: MBOAT family protein [Clostridia bacterium]|nr:MBOAT family protein [Clostridia bacterium]